MRGRSLVQLALHASQKPLACPRPEGGDSDVDFDELIDRRGTDSKKWDLMEPALGVPAADGLAMWIADMDYATPGFLKNAVQGILDRDSYGYYRYVQGARVYTRCLSAYADPVRDNCRSYGYGRGRYNYPDSIGRGRYVSRRLMVLFFVMRKQF